MTPPIGPGSPVRLLTRLRPPARILPVLEGVVERLDPDGDRAWIRWADGARSSARLQFLALMFRDATNARSRATTLTRAADRADTARSIARAFEVPVQILAMTTAHDGPRPSYNSGWAHLVADGLAGPDDGRPHMDPSELED